MALTQKQKLFVKEYLIDLNATQAAIRAGYSEKTAYSTGQENLNKPEIKAAVDKALERRGNRTNITADRVLLEISRLAFFDARKLYNDDGSPKRITEIDDDTAAAITGIDTAEMGGSEGTQVTVKKYKATDKKGPLEMLVKHLGIDRLKEAHDLDLEYKRLMIKKAQAEIDVINRNNGADDSGLPEEEYILSPDEPIPNDPIL